MTSQLGNAAGAGPGNNSETAALDNEEDDDSDDEEEEAPPCELGFAEPCDWPLLLNRVSRESLSMYSTGRRRKHTLQNGIFKTIRSN